MSQRRHTISRSSVILSPDHILRILDILRKDAERLGKPMIFLISEQFGKNPFLVLISCLLSLRTKDTVTLPASLRLFERATNPDQILHLSSKELEDILYPVGFYRKKARLLPAVCQDLIDRFDGKVPDSIDQLLSIKGVGRKTANLVLSEGFGIPAICVDTHVHRIANRLGLVNTTTVDQTEQALKKVIPEADWIHINRWLVVWGQQICVPISPWCSRCPLKNECQKRKVVKSR